MPTVEADRLENIVCKPRADSRLMSPRGRSTSMSFLR